ncbi:MAG TPA: glycosyltransferase family 39 protein [Frateuria sp.]|uniref:ArnT family glycosyltransferase n=1 Tax=Frateuria sp. TaxID=2211372 RepID=UPI002D7F6DBD|nr:glycosyltransferase family 39 protein [Frateuria sp.]HET6806297.1 glycosyltransferase family 39 protein [Frateuria sp.]
MSPFGDEAFYWLESRHPAWGYSDLPPLTAWLIWLGERVAGHGLVGMRWPFLLLGSALPWVMVAFGRRAFDARAGWQAGLLCLALPLAGTFGVMAMPDVPLTLAIAVGLYALLRAMDEGRLRDWLLLGFALAAAWLTHYRAAMAMFAGLLLLACTPRGRAQWRRGGLWLALAVAALGLVPLIESNWRQHGAGIAFQLVDRNPWRFHADALVQPLEQAIACTPVLYVVLLWVLWTSWRRRCEGAPWDLLAWTSLGFLAPYFLLGLFADDQRFRAHWPLPGYLPLLAALPALCREAGRGWRVVSAAGGLLGGLGTLLGLGYLALAASPRGADVLASGRAFPTHFVGWREGAAQARTLLQQRDAVLVADNFMLAAELEFQFGGQRPVYSLDSGLNAKHGRASQLAVWQRDENGLRAAHAGEPMLLVVSEVMRERERLERLGAICGSVEAPRLVTRLVLFSGRKSLAYYRGRVPDVLREGQAADPAQCVFWRNARAAAEGV